MRLGKKRTKQIILIVLLILIVAGTLAYKLDLIDLEPEYSSQINKDEKKDIEATTESETDTDTPVLPPYVKENMSVVAIVKSKEEKAESIKYEEIKQMVENAVDMAGGFEGLIKDGHTVIIKPNLVTPIDYTLPGWRGKPLDPEVNGTTTDYRVTKAIVELVRKYNPNGKVYVMEGSAFPTRECMNQLNYTPEYIPGVDEFICIEEDSGEWKDYNSSKLVNVPVENGLVTDDVYMNKRYKEADVVISVPVLKTHWTEITSGSIKNIGIGATPANIYGGNNPGEVNRTATLDHTKEILDKWIHDWYAARPIEFAIFDGLQGIQNGPTPCYDQTKTTDIKQDQMNTRLIIASSDCIAADTIASLIMQWDPDEVKYLGYLEKRGLGYSNTANIQVVGKRVHEVRKDFKGTSEIGKFTDLTPPEITISNAEAKDNKINILLNANQETTKIEMMVNNEIKSIIVPNNPDSLTITIDGIYNSKLVNTITLNAYDKYLNCTQKQFRVFNDKQSGVNNIVFSIDECNYEAPKAVSTPVIDGYADDDCWKSAPWKELKYAWGEVTTLPDSQDFSGRYKMVWTPEKLFLLAEIKDDALVDSHKNPLDNYWDDDTLEIFIDEDHSGGDHRLNYNAFAYHLALDYNIVDLIKHKDIKPGLFNNNMIYKRIDSGEASIWEVAIDVYGDDYSDNSDKNKPVILFAGKEIGFALAYCDSDKKKRENFVGSIPIPEGLDYGWINADVFATLKLTENN